VTYSTIKAVLEAVLVAKGLCRSNQFDISEDGFYVQDSGYAILRKSLGIGSRLAETVHEMELTLEIHISTAYEPSTYDDNDDATGEVIEDIMVAIEEIGISTRADQQISDIKCGTSSTTRQADGRLHEQFDVTITYRSV
jgi:hypothetical protein